MKVTLRNFRCHTLAAFELPDNGLILLDGKSGAGKSTLLEGLFFAFYGTLRKPYTFGANSCRVDVVTKVWKVSRQCRPNRLVVSYKDSTYEDEAGQGVINQKILGLDVHEFMVSAYAKQKSAVSLLSLPPGEQLSLIEKITLRGCNVEEIRRKSTDIIRRCQNEQVAGTTERELLEKQLAELEEEIGDLGDIPDERELAQWEEEHHGVEQRWSKLAQIIPLVQQYQKNRARLEESNKRYQERSDEIEEKLRALAEERGQLDALASNAEEAKKEGEIIRAWLEYNKTKEQFDQENARYQDMVKEERFELEAEIKKINRKIWSHSEKAELLARKKEGEKKVRHTRVLLREWERWHDYLLASLREDELESKTWQEIEAALPVLLEKYEQQHLALAQGVKRQCPNCDVWLCVDEDHLILAEDRKEPEPLPGGAARLERLRKVSLHMASRPEAPPEDIEADEQRHEEVRKICDEQLAAEARKEQLSDQLERNILSVSLNSMKKRLDTTEVELARMNKKLPSLDPDQVLTVARLRELEEYLKQRKAIVQQQKEWKKQLRGLTEEKEKLEGDCHEEKKELKKLGAKPKELDQLKKEQRELEGKKKLFEERQEIIEQAQALAQKKVQLNKWSEKADSSRRKERKAQRHLEVALWLKEKVVLAEVLALAQTLDTVNEYAATHLATMFREPIEVQLQPFRQTKGGNEKPQLQVIVNHQGNASSLSALSGGEQDRCSLAFLLALNQYLDGQFMFLDECLASLDSETSSEILQSLRELAKDRLILIVSHQSTMGFYDAIVNVVD